MFRGRGKRTGRGPKSENQSYGQAVVLKLGICGRRMMKWARVHGPFDRSGWVFAHWRADTVVANHTDCRPGFPRINKDPTVHVEQSS